MHQGIAVHKKVIDFKPLHIPWLESCLKVFHLELWWLFPFFVVMFWLLTKFLSWPWSCYWCSGPNVVVDQMMWWTKWCGGPRDAVDVVDQMMLSLRSSVDVATVFWFCVSQSSVIMIEYLRKSTWRRQHLFSIMISEVWDTIIFCSIISEPVERKAHHGRWERIKIIEIWRDIRLGEIEL